ncbi:NAD(P)-binding protein [Exidia glandulosa HHB12029]|uniref:NAD(P)-binding protein n=1 Tax=Exidia glandulosa HHB12029 TaxID=1314781 RepID=A0A165CL69_EXIGL|nr:NAD(P)-binding protein [Exidia glandulosa HHB12029]
MSGTFGHSTTAEEVVAAYSDRVKGRILLVTGPTPNTLGDATARSLARAQPAALILVGRSPAKYAPVADAIRAIDPSIDVRIYGVDLSSLASVREGARTIAAAHPRIDVLINNAGIMGIPERRLNADGIEEHFATNHVGHFLLTNLLMDSLMRSDEPRVVNLTSWGHKWGTGDYSDYNFEHRPYEWNLGYGQSKLANIHFTGSLAAKLGPRGLSAISVHPGSIWETDLTASFSEEQRKKLREHDDDAGVVTKTLSQGASTTLVAALDPNLGKAHSGCYMEDCHVSETRCDGARRPGARDELWALSEKLVGETFAY